MVIKDVQLNTEKAAKKTVRKLSKSFPCWTFSIIPDSVNGRFSIDAIRGYIPPNWDENKKQYYHNLFLQAIIDSHM